MPKIPALLASMSGPRLVLKLSIETVAGYGVARDGGGSRWRSRYTIL
jgi:hypothetical protein